MTTVIVLLFVFLASIGIGYALWSKTLHIDGTVNTGSVDSVFVNPFTDDDNVLNNSLDPGDSGDCAISVNEGGGSCDPAEFGPKASRKDKDVGQCFVEFDESDKTGETLKVTVVNAYPSYYCTVFFDVKNTGTVPVKIITLALVGQSVTAGNITGEWSELKIGQQIDPGDVVPGNLGLHVEQSSPQSSTLTLYGKIQLAQWNEATPLEWKSCSAGDGACTQAPEVVFANNTIIMGQLGAADSTGTAQNTSVHGGAALLPKGTKYAVTFQYHVCSWDSYNPVGVLGTGYWDSFSVSTSDKPYWNMGYGDPVGGANFPWVFGGTNYNDGILDCSNGTQTASLPGYPGGTYLNAVLDTASQPQANHAHPSFGTITIEKVVVTP